MIEMEIFMISKSQSNLFQDSKENKGKVLLDGVAQWEDRLRSEFKPHHRLLFTTAKNCILIA